MTSTQPRPIRVVESEPGSAAPAGQPSAVTAAGEVHYPLKPPAEWFADPQLDGPTQLRITDDGQFWGHVASFGVRHIGLPGNVTAPRSKTDYRRFKTGTMVCAGGEEVRVGRLTMDTSHAAMDLTADGASRHYDETGSIIGFCNAGHDDHGIWVAGSLRPDIDPADVIIARGSPLSGDWRSVDGNLELVGALAVVVNGFEIPEPLAQVASGQPMSLVAAGMFITDSDEETPMPDTDTPESLTAASPNPFSKGEPAPPSGDDDEGGEAYESGDSVLLDDLDVVAQVVGDDGEGGVTIEVTVPSSMLSRADEDTAMAASARFTERMADRVRDRDMRDLKGMVASLTETVKGQNEQLTSQSAQLERYATERRNAAFDAAEAELLPAPKASA